MRQRLICLLCSKPYGGRPRGRNSGRGGVAMDNPDDSALRRLGLPISSSGRDRLQGNSDSRWKIIVRSIGHLRRYHSSFSDFGSIVHSSYSIVYLYSCLVHVFLYNVFPPPADSFNYNGTQIWQNLKTTEWKTKWSWEKYEIYDRVSP